MKHLLFISLFFFTAGAGAENFPEVSVDNVRCDVRISYGSSGSSRCFFNEVMIGIDSVDPLRIRCGRVDVTCPNRNNETIEAKVADTEGFEF